MFIPMARSQQMSDLGAFVAGVRAGHIDQPNQHGFDPDVWRADYEAVKQPTTRDESLYDSGLLAYLIFSAVRRQVEEVGPLPIPPREGARLMCAMVNRDVCQISELLADHLQSRVDTEGAFNIQAVYDRFLRAEASGNEVDVSQAIEVSVDGVTYPLRSIIRGWTPGEPTIEANDDLGLIQASMVMYLSGQLWAWLDLVWRKCVYGDVELVLEGGRLVFQPIDSIVARRRELSARREEAMIVQRAREVTFELRQMPDVDRAVRKRDVLLKAGRRPPYRVRVGALRDRGQRRLDSAQWLRGRLMFKADYPEALLKAPLDAFDGLTAETMLRAWEALAPFVDQVASTFRHPDLIDTVKGTFEFAPTVSEDSLLAGWTRSLEVTPKEARALLRAFTFRGELRDALWSRPLVRVGDGAIVFVVTAITSPNVRWLLETWLRSGGINLEERGAWFEREVQQEVSSGLDGSPLPDVWVSEGSFVARGSPASPGDPEAEEIDLIVRIGRTVLVCEVKCSLVPMDDVLAEMNYLGVLENGAVQAARKARFMAANREPTAELIGAGQGHEVDKLRYVPVLVTNVAVGVGQTVKGVPVTDASLLRQYIQYGYQLRSVRLHQDGTYEGGERFAFYEDITQAETNIDHYLSDPPQITVLEPLIRDVEMKICEIEGYEVFHRYPVVEMPADSQNPT